MALLERKNSRNSLKIILYPMVHLLEEQRLTRQATACFLIKPRILNSNGRFIGKGNHQLHLLLAQRITLAAEDTDGTTNLTPTLQWHTEDALNIWQQLWGGAQKTRLIGVHTANRSKRLAVSHCSTGAALTNFHCCPIKHLCIKAIARQQTHLLRLLIQFKDCRTLCTT